MVDHRRLRLPKTVSDVVDFKAHFRDYSRVLNDIIPRVRNKSAKNFVQTLGFTTTEYEAVKSKFAQNKDSWKSYQPHKLHVPVKGFHPEFNIYNVPSDSTLRTTECLKRNFKKETLNSRSQLVRYPGQIFCEVPEEGDVEEVMKESLKPYSDYILCVRVYIQNKHHAFAGNHRTKRLTVSQEFLVTGKSGLCSLRDRILCEEDYMPAEGDVSENPFLPTKLTNRNVFRSSMFFINDKFYVDCRCSSNLDYSVEVKEWAARKKLPYTKTELMEDTTFDSISFRLGYPYLYQHQGACEHLIIFTDARLSIPSDILSKAAYPIMKSYSCIRGKRCSLCAKKIPKFIVVGMKELPNAKSFLCGPCLFRFCYTQEGKKISEFSVFKYVDRVAIL